MRTQIKIFQALGGAGIKRVEENVNGWLHTLPEGTDVLGIHTALGECSEPNETYQAYTLTAWYRPPLYPVVA